MGGNREDRLKMDASRDYPEEVLCPSCGKFVGAYERCPYCGTELKKRMSIVFFKRAAIVVALGGLFLLWLTATKLKPQLIKINEITPMYSNAVVEVRGTVLSTKMTRKDDITFIVADGTGELRCQAFRGREKMRQTGNLPHAGDMARVIGQINMTDRWGTSLMINVPSNVEVTPVKSERVAIGDISEEDRGRSVEVVGEIVSAFERGGNVFMMIGDTTGVIDMPMWKSDLDRIESEEHRKEITTMGREIRVRGSVGEFRGKPQIQYRDVDEIEVLAEDTIPGKKIPRWKGARSSGKKKLQKMEIGKITLDDEGRLVEVRGEVVRAWPGKKKTDLLIGDTTGVIRIPLWNRAMKRLDGAKRKEIVTPGRELTIIGTVSQWKGKLQLEVRNFETVEVLTDDIIPTENIPGWKKKQEQVLKDMPPAMRGAEERAEEVPVTTY
jgi:DNA/RNA endonuclease YhcR with UshA esterase domain